MIDWDWKLILLPFGRLPVRRALCFAGWAELDLMIEDALAKAVFVDAGAVFGDVGVTRLLTAVVAITA